MVCHNKSISIVKITKISLLVPEPIESGEPDDNFDQYRALNQY